MISTLGELVARDERAAARTISKVGAYLGMPDDDAPPIALVDRDEKRVQEIKAELQRMNSRPFNQMSPSDRARFRGLHDEWSILIGRISENKLRDAREQSLAEERSVRKARPLAIAAARETVATLRKHADAVNSRRVVVDARVRQRLVAALSIAEIELAELTR